MSSQPISTRSLVKPRLRGWKALLTYHTFRNLVQLAFAPFIIFITVQHVTDGEGSTNITASPEVYCLFGGLESL